MAGQDRGTLPLVIQGLADKPQSYSYFQAIRLLKLWTGKTGEAEAQGFYDDTLRVRPHLSLSFPGSDMTEILLEPESEDQAARVDITATFLGLYGTGSPLPTFYTEELLDERSDDKSVSRDFLDILGNRTFIHFYRAWAKYRLLVKAVDEEDRDYLDRLYCLLGLGHEELRSKLSRPSAALRYIGLFTQYPRSALGLKTMLADAVGQARCVDVEQCVHRWVPIPDDQRNSLGASGCTLGEDCWVGGLVEDRMGKIVVEFGGLDAAKFHELLPGRELNYHVESLIGMYLVEPVEHDLRLKLLPGQVQPARPGHPQWSRLGYDTWILSEGFVGEAEVTFPGLSGVPA